MFGLRASHLERLAFAVAVCFAIICMKKFAIFLATLDLIVSVFRKKPDNSQSGDILNWKKSDAFSRFVGMVICIACLPNDIITHDFWFECVIIGGLFRACSDLPPAESKVRSVLRGLFNMNITGATANE